MNLGAELATLCLNVTNAERDLCLDAARAHQIDIDQLTAYIDTVQALVERLADILEELTR